MDIMGDWLQESVMGELAHLFGILMVTLFSILSATASVWAIIWMWKDMML